MGHPLPTLSAGSRAAGGGEEPFQGPECLRGALLEPPLPPITAEEHTEQAAGKLRLAQTQSPQLVSVNTEGYRTY